MHVCPHVGGFMYIAMRLVGLRWIFEIAQKNARLLTNTWIYEYCSEISWSEMDF